MPSSLADGYPSLHGILHNKAATHLTPRKISKINFYSCTVHLDTIESFIYPTDAQLDCSKNVKIHIKIYKRGAPACFGFSQPSSVSYYMCFAKVVSINNQLKYVIYRICSV
jgi:hypothetical protein